jgi:hypothetical protein
LLVCRLIGHRWGESRLQVGGRVRDEGNYTMTCDRCGASVVFWYGHPAPNIGVSLLRHRFRIRHWKV